MLICYLLNRFGLCGVAYPIPVSVYLFLFGFIQRLNDPFSLYAVFFPGVSGVYLCLSGFVQFLLDLIWGTNEQLLYKSNSSESAVQGNVLFTTADPEMIPREMLATTEDPGTIPRNTLFCSRGCRVHEGTSRQWFSVRQQVMKLCRAIYFLTTEGSRNVHKGQIHRYNRGVWNHTRTQMYLTPRTKLQHNCCTTLPHPMEADVFVRVTISSTRMTHARGVGTPMTQETRSL